MLAWLIIGGGIHGVHLAYLLTTAKGVSREELRVLDPHPEPLARWNRLTANTGMAYLRSPAVHNLGLTADALDTFAASPAAWVYRTYREPYSRPGYDSRSADQLHLGQTPTVTCPLYHQKRKCS